MSSLSFPSEPLPQVTSISLSSHSDQLSKSAAETLLDQYCEVSKSQVNEFYREREIEPTRRISEEQLNSATPLSAGVAGASKLQLNGENFVLKRPLLTPTFTKNAQTLIDRHQPLSSRQISESDDSFAHFPRKEVVGCLVAHQFNLPTPHTELAKTESGEVVSLQHFMSDASSWMEEAAPLHEIEMDSLFKIAMFQLVTENIDGHAGNILLNKLPEQEDDDLDDMPPKYQALPIDFGLIFPRHESVYPKEMNLLNKGVIFSLQQKGKKVNLQKLFKGIDLNPEVFITDEMKKVLTPGELKILTRNLTALNKCVQESEGSCPLSEIIDKLTKEIVLLKSNEK